MSMSYDPESHDFLQLLNYTCLRLSRLCDTKGINTIYKLKDEMITALLPYGDNTWIEEPGYITVKFFIENNTSCTELRRHLTEELGIRVKRIDSKSDLYKKIIDNCRGAIPLIETIVDQRDPSAPELLESRRNDVPEDTPGDDPMVAMCCPNCHLTSFFDHTSPLCFTQNITLPKFIADGFIGDTYHCQICMEDKPTHDIGINECGHKACHTCWEKIAICHSCRIPKNLYSII